MDKDSPRPTNIYIIGAQCTGKTTIVNSLRDHFGKEGSCVWRGQPVPPPVYLMEVARTVLIEHNFKAEDITSSPTRSLQLQKLILQAQAQAERAAGDTWFVSDRSGLDPIIYARKYVGENAAQDMMMTQQWKELEETMRRSLIVVCEAGMDWLTDDGVRLMPLDREEWIGFHEAFVAALEKGSILYVIIPKGMLDLQERVEFVLRYWENI
ncbi:MAG: hypothetical protein M1812_007191 [Candelaria pacifica]|nr:MAG: hypothetical protein M1812_007191 [Candelaria pacifica]